MATIDITPLQNLASNSNVHSWLSVAAGVIALLLMAPQNPGNPQAGLPPVQPPAIMQSDKPAQQGLTWYGLTQDEIAVIEKLRKQVTK